MTENRSVFASRGSSEHFRTSWVELSWVESGRALWSLEKLRQTSRDPVFSYRPIAALSHRGHRYLGQCSKVPKTCRLIVKRRCKAILLSHFMHLFAIKTTALAVILRFLTNGTVYTTITCTLTLVRIGIILYIKRDRLFRDLVINLLRLFLLLLSLYFSMLLLLFRQWIKVIQ